MGKKILLSVTDPINAGECATCAVDLARRCSMALEMIHVRHVDDHFETWRALDRFQERATENGVEASVRIIDGHSIREVLSASTNVELVILSDVNQVRDWRSGLFSLGIQIDEEELVSPVTRSVIKNLAIPALVFNGQRSEMKRPLFAYNGSPKSRYMLQEALRLMSHRVFEDGVLLYVGKRSNKALVALESAQSYVGQRYRMKLKTRFVSGDVPSAVFEEVERSDCDMIVMGAYGRSWFERKIFGSVTEKILGRSSMPVLLG